MAGVGGAPVEPEEAWPSPGAVVSAFGLGGGPTEMLAVGRALSNRVYRLETGGEAYAVKELRAPGDVERWFEWLEASFLFEQRAMAAGVRAPEPVTRPDGSLVAWVERRTQAGLVPVRVHRWVDGRPCPLGPAEPAVAEWAGRTLAVLHGLRVLPADRSLYPAPNTDAADRWPALVAAAVERRAGFADALVGLAPFVARAADLAREGLDGGGEEVISHGDVDQKNILLGADGPVLCDWDLASPWVPRRELVTTALSMGAGTDFGAARRVVAAYQGATGVPVHLHGTDLAPSLMIGLDWVAMNVERAVGLRAATPAEEDLAAGLVPGLLAGYRHAVELAEAVPRLLSV